MVLGYSLWIFTLGYFLQILEGEEGMISQAIQSSYTPIKSGRQGFSVTSLSPCQYETFIHFRHLDPKDRKPQEMMVMSDGNWQETQVVALIRKAGFKLEHVLKEQLTIHVGKTRIPGHPDGLIHTESIDLLEIKAMNLNRYTDFVQKGLDTFSRIKCQVQSYMISDELKDVVSRCWILIKHKDTCRLYDVCEERDESFIKPIIEAADAIALENYEPPKVRCDDCTTCYHKLFCWSEEIIDMSKGKVVSLEEVSSKWKEGKLFKTHGEVLIAEAREIFEAELGDKEVLYCDDLKIQRIISHRNEIPIAKFVEVFGPDKLASVIVPKEIPQMRIQEVL